MPHKILGVILAGGESSRMGRDKAFVLLAGRPMIAHVAERLRPQVDALALAGGAAPERFAALGLEAFADAQGEKLGPLAGVVAALDHAAARGFSHVVTAPCDAPFLPLDLVARLAASGGAAVVELGGKFEPTFALWPASAAGEARRLLGESAGPMALARAVGALAVSFLDGADFANVNSRHELARAENRLKGSGRG